MSNNTRYHVNLNITSQSLCNNPQVSEMFSIVLFLLSQIPVWITQTVDDDD